METLMHTCCAPCSVSCIRQLREEGIEPVSFWYNPNIHPYQEYKARRDTLMAYAPAIGMKLIVREDYGLRDFCRAVCGDIDHRCGRCYHIRLWETARYAAEHGYGSFTSTLFVSPYQNHELLRQTAERAFSFVVLFVPLVTLIMGGTIMSIMWLGGRYVVGGTMLSGDLIAFFTYASEILMSLMMVAMVMMVLTRSIACGKRIVEVLEEQPEITDSAADPALTVENGEVDFDHVYFKYHKDSGAWNLEDVCLHIDSGMTVGILGGTGSAKSTLVSLIPRLYEATEGAVSVGGHDVREYTMEGLRQGCAMVLQKNTLFSGTIRENLRWGREDATDQEMEEACRMACADEFISRMPDGYDTHIEQGGANVSGGQKQRLCIARAILRRPRVLILDDSTSAVDTATDAKIRSALRQALPGATKLIIAQRISSVMDADLIVVLDDGKISGAGTHDQLMASNHIYQEVYKSQQEGATIDG